MEGFDKKIQRYLTERGEVDSLTIGREFGREFGWKTVFDAENAIKRVDGVVFRVADDNGGVLWSFDHKRSRLYNWRLRGSY